MARKGVFKRGNVWWIHYTGLDGRQKKESSRSRRVKDAEDLLVHRKYQVQQGQRLEIIRLKDNNFQQLAEKYEAFCQHQKGFRNKKSLIKMMREEFGILPLKFFTLEFVEQHQQKLLASGLSEATVNRRIGCLKNMFTKATEWRLASEAMRDEVHRVKMFKESITRDRFLSREEIDRLLAACDADQLTHLKPIIAFAINTGCRKEEILSLTWQQVDLAHGFITLYKTKSGERREIPINEPLRAVLEVLPRRKDDPHVFINAKTGKRFRDVKRSYKTALEIAGLDDNEVVFHTLRHTFASHLVMAGVDIPTVAKLMGHKSITVTMRYSHLAPNHLSNAVGVLAAALQMPAA